MKKPSFHISFSFRNIEPGKLIRWITWCGLAVYTILVCSLLFTHVLRNFYFPREIDPSQITAKQEQVDQKRLQRVLERHKNKTEAEEITSPINPFVQRP